MVHHLYVLVIVVVCCIHGHRGDHLIGEHVCPQDEKYTVTFEKPIRKTVRIREFVWCMSVPPRCSKYVNKEVDGIEIVEENRVKKVDKCCEGYIEDNTRTYCIPECKSCINGICTSPENCSCIAGYTGVSCNETCDTGFWGQNCSLQCACSNGALCSAETGSCICDAGTSGPKCEYSLSSTTTKYAVENQSSTTQKPVNNTTKEPDITTTKKSTIQTVQTLISPETTKPPLEEKNKTDYNTSSKKNFNSIGKTHQFSDKKPEHLHLDQITIENKSNTSVKDTLLVFIISVAVGIAIILILVAIMSIMIARYKIQRDLAIKNVLSIKSSIDNNRNRLSTEPIIQRSVFHAPLPDPPVFQNPVFTLRDTQNIKVQYCNCSELSSPESQSQYDFPPSSGSYRAVSLPNPSLETTIEPVYDEIPANRRPRPVSSVAECKHSCCANSHCQWNDT